MNKTLLFAIIVAIGQGFTLYGLSQLAKGELGIWSELVFLLPAYAIIIGVTLTWYLLRSWLSTKVLWFTLAKVGIALVVTGAYIGWVNGPVGELWPKSIGSVFLFCFLTVIAWFIALPFLRFGVKNGLSAEGYVVIYDEAWRLAITIIFALLFVGLFWILLALFVGIFDSIRIEWPKQIIYKSYFYYPATCAATSFAISLTDVKPEMFHALRRLLFTLLRWLTVLAAVIVLLFLGAILVEGVEPLWNTRFATFGLGSLAFALICLYNTVYQDGSESGALPRILAWLVRAALIVGPVLAVLAYWALALRIQQHGLSEDRLYAILVVTILSGYLIGYCLVSVYSRAVSLSIRQINVVMALTIIVAIIAVHSPLADFKRIAADSQMARVAKNGDRFDFRYLRFDAGRHGIVALQKLVTSQPASIARQARLALTETIQRDYGRVDKYKPKDKTQFAARLNVYPEGKMLPEDLREHLFITYKNNPYSLACIDQGTPCTVLVMDLNSDGQDEVITQLSSVYFVYSFNDGNWIEAGRLLSYDYRSHDEDIIAALMQNKLKVTPQVQFRGLEIGTNKFYFVPNDSDTQD